MIETKILKMNSDRRIRGAKPAFLKKEILGISQQKRTQ
jgi:hypothetical protein